MTVLKEYRPPKVDSPVPHPLNGGMSDVRAMLRVAKPQHVPLIALIGFLGLRVSEALAARTTDLFDAHGATWLKVRGKGDKTRDIPVAEEVFEMIHSFMGEDDDRFVRLTDRAARRAWTRIARRAGLGHSATHDGRMTFGSMVHDMTSNIRVTQELLGHSSVETTQNYTAVTPDAKKAAVGGLL